MLMPSSDAIRLDLGGLTCDTWKRYRVDSDLLTPADGWELSLGKFERALPAKMYEGAPVRLWLGDDLILSGSIDHIEDSTRKASGRQISISGRDDGAFLVDCSADILTLNQATLKQIMTKAVLPLGIKKVAWRAPEKTIRKRVHTEPGQSVWEWLQEACEANNVWPWFEPDGTLVIGEPDYTVAPVATLIEDGERTNVEEFTVVRDLTNRFSKVTVYGQAAGDGEDGIAHVVGEATDDAVRVKRHKVVVDGNCETTALAKARAQKLIGDGRMAGTEIRILVTGHRAPGGWVWKPGMRCTLVSPNKQVNGVYYLKKRILKLERSEGKTTELHFIEDGSWMLHLAYIKAKRRNDFHKRRGSYIE